MGETVYSGAKGGAIAFTKSLAREVARYNINVNAVCPGPTDTPMPPPLALREAFLKGSRSAASLPEEIADAVSTSPARNPPIPGRMSVSGGRLAG